MFHVIGLGQFHQLTRSDHVDVGANRLQGGRFACVDQLVIAHQFGVAQATNFIFRKEPVKQHLIEGQGRIGMGVRTSRGAWPILPLKPYARAQINFWKETAPH